MAVLPWREPSQTQFFTALSVFALVLVCTSVFMTQKPPWMEGKEADLGISSPFIAPSAGGSEPYMYTDPQMRDMGVNVPEDEDKGRPQKLAQMRGPRLSGKAAVEAAAAHPGGLLHGDDAYVRVGTGQVLTAAQRVKAARGDEVKEAQQLRAIAAKRGRVRSPQVRYKGSDAVVPMTQVQAETYPLMNLASQDSNGAPAAPEANRLLAAKIKATGAGNGNYVDTTEGSVTGEAPLTQIGNAVASAGYSDKATPVDEARSSTWAYYGAIFVVMVGSSLLLLYYMLPKGAIERAMKGDLGIYQQYSEETGPRPPPAEEDKNWNRGFGVAEAQGVSMPERPERQRDYLPTAPTPRTAQSAAGSRPLSTVEEALPPMPTDADRQPRETTLV